MKAIVCQTPGVLREIEVPMPELRQGEVLIQIRKVGICGTDLHAYSGNQPFFSYPRILGHELAGEITSLNNVTGTELSVGEQVVIIPYLNCGVCLACRCGKTNCCVSLKVLGVHIDGGMQGFISHPVSLLLKAPDLTSAQQSIVEPLSIGWHAVGRAKIQAGQWVLVSGCGPIGVGIIWAASLKGARVIAVDPDRRRLAFCRDYFDVDHTLPVNEDTLPEISKITGGDMAEFVFDATGLKQAMEKGVDYLSPGGTYILVGLNKGDLTFHHPSIHAREISILCSRNATKSDFEAVIENMVVHKFPSEKYISHTANFEQIPDHFDVWKNPENEVMKVVTSW